MAGKGQVHVCLRCLPPRCPPVGVRRGSGASGCGRRLPSVGPPVLPTSVPSAPPRPRAPLDPENRTRTSALSPSARSDALLSTPFVRPSSADGASAFIRRGRPSGGCRALRLAYCAAAHRPPVGRGGAGAPLGALRRGGVRRVCPRTLSGEAMRHAKLISIRSQAAGARALFLSFSSAEAAGWWRRSSGGEGGGLLSACVVDQHQRQRGGDDAAPPPPPSPLLVFSLPALRLRRPSSGSSFFVSSTHLLPLHPPVVPAAASGAAPGAAASADLI